MCCGFMEGGHFQGLDWKQLPSLGHDEFGPITWERHVAWGVTIERERKRGTKTVKLYRIGREVFRKQWMALERAAELGQAEIKRQAYLQQLRYYETQLRRKESGDHSFYWRPGMPGPEKWLEANAPILVS